MFAEEAFLRRNFGDEYLDWADSTPAFIPRSGNYRKPVLPFSLKKVPRKEYNGFFAVIVAMFILEEFGEIILKGQPGWDVPWVVLLCLGSAVWTILRVLKKRTTWLHKRVR